MSKETSSHPKKYSELNFPYTRKNKKGMGIFHIPDERGMKALLYPKHSLLTPPPFPLMIREPHTLIREHLIL